MESNGEARWSIKRRGDTYVATVSFDAGPPAHVGAEGSTERQALARASVLAKRLAESDVFRAVAPPGTALAIKAIHALATSRDVRATLEKYSGRGARRLARVLKFW